MSPRRIILLVVGAVALIALYGSIFTVRETEQVIVMQYGNPKRIVQDAGLHFKLPVVQQAQYLDKRILNLDVHLDEVIASDQKRLVVDAFARFRIVDPLLTFQSVTDENGARRQLEIIVKSNARKVLGNQPFRNIVSGERAELMHQIRDAVNTEAVNFGIEIVDARLKRVDLPQQNEQNIYARMRTEREREAQEARSEGEEQKQRIMAQAERERTVLIAEAQRDSEILRGEGDSEAVRIFAEAFGKDEDFYEFYRSMQAYRVALGKNDTTLILSPDSQFFKFFEGSAGRGGN